MENTKTNKRKRQTAQPVAATKPSLIERWRKDAQKWAAELVQSAPVNDWPPGFEPDDEQSYPIVIRD